MALAFSTVTLPPVVAQAVAAIALGLLGASGVLKWVDPEPTTGAMSAAHLPSSNTLSRLLGLVEMAVSVAALAIGGVSTVAAVFLYAAFTVFTLVAVVYRIPLQSCGCFGREDTPPTVVHVVFNVVATGALVFVAFADTEPIDWALPTIDLVPYLAFTGIGVYASYLILARLPQVLQPTRRT